MSISKYIDIFKVISQQSRLYFLLFKHTFVSGQCGDEFTAEVSKPRLRKGNAHCAAL